MGRHNVVSLLTLLIVRLFMQVSRFRFTIFSKIAGWVTKSLVGKLNFVVFYALTTFVTQCPVRTIQHVCPNENVTFWLYNSKTEPYLFNENDNDSLKNAPIIPYHPIKILIHGFDGNRAESPNRQVRPHYLAMDYNVISVDYGKVAKQPCYLQAVESVNTVGECIGKFLLKLLQSNSAVDSEMVHIIGFSLGTHVAARAGRLLTSYGVLLNRITVLDPAAPLFYERTDFTVPRCARFIDAVHTNAGMSGQTTAVADTDFYANFLLFQKGCDFYNVACHHARASDYYAESITTLKGFWGYPLENQAELEILGEYISLKARGSYYVATNQKSPYASGTTFPDLFDLLRDNIENYITAVYDVIMLALIRSRLTLLARWLTLLHDFFSNWLNFLEY